MLEVLLHSLDLTLHPGLNALKLPAGWRSADVLAQWPSAALCRMLLVLHWGDVLACCSVTESMSACALNCGSRPAMKDSMPSKGQTFAAGKKAVPLADLPRWRVELLLGTFVVDMSLYRRALTAPIAAPNSIGASYERLEYLGDAILEGIARQFIYTRCVLLRSLLQKICQQPRLEPVHY